MNNLTENSCKLSNENGFDFDNHSDLSTGNMTQEKYRFIEVNF